MLTMLLSCGCVNRNNKNAKQEQTYTVEGHDIAITLSGEWRQSFSENENISIQFTDNHSYLTIIAYQRNTLPEDKTAEKLYEFHKNDIISKRKNVKTEVKKQTRMIKGKTITSEYIIADFDDIKSGYYINLIEFDKNKEQLAFVLFTAQPQKGLKKIPDWDKIIADISLESEIQ